MRAPIELLAWMNACGSITVMELALRLKLPQGKRKTT